MINSQLHKYNTKSLMAVSVLLRLSAKALVLVFICMLAGPVSAQVGINNENPDSCALLHIGEDNEKKGLLIPFIEDIGTVNTSDFAESMLFYTPEEESFLFWDGSEWQKVNPFIVKTAEENVSTRKNITAAKENNTEGHKYHVQNSTNKTGVPTIPVGGIITWSGDPDQLPCNWKLCNGTGNYYNPLSNTTIPVPDLRNRFIVGYDPADSDYDTIGKQGPPGNSPVYNLEAGGAKIALGRRSMPEHNHDVIDAGHTHDHTLETDTIKTSYYLKAEKDYINEEVSGEATSKYPGNESVFAHKHDFNIAILRDTANVDIYNYGDGDAHENRPPYYVLAYIIRVW